MGREIKFRWYDELHKRMWYGHQAGEGEGEWTFQEFTDKEKGLIGIIHRTIDVGFGKNNGPYEEVELPGMQYTGFEGVYEGDILYGQESGEYGSILSSWYGVVYWDEEKCGFYVKDDLDEEYRLDDYDFSKIIGNIYEHPHLLEVTP